MVAIDNIRAQALANMPPLALADDQNHIIPAIFDINADPHGPYVPGQDLAPYMGPQHARIDAAIDLGIETGALADAQTHDIHQHPIIEMPPPLTSSTQTHDEDEADVIHEFQLRMRFSVVSVVHALLRVVHCVHIDSVFTVSHHMCAEADGHIIEDANPLARRTDGMYPLSADALTDYGNW